MLYQTICIKSGCTGSKEQWVEGGSQEVVNGRRWHLLQHVHMPSSGSFVSDDLLRYEARKRDKMLVLITLIAVDQISKALGECISR